MDPNLALTLDELNEVIDEILEDFQRREDQAILQQDLYKANYALAGKETCKEVKRRVELRLQMHENRLRNLSARKRA